MEIKPETQITCLHHWMTNPMIRERFHWYKPVAHPQVKWADSSLWLFYISDTFSTTLCCVLLMEYPQILLCKYRETHLTDELTNTNKLDVGWGQNKL